MRGKWQWQKAGRGNGWKEVRRSSIQALKLHNSDLFDYGSMELGVILEEVRRSSIQALKLHNSDVFDYGSMKFEVVYIDSTRLLPE